ncbi:MAG: hypothetical protein O3C43_11965 [Verrucomicrobia bacterium]|jgi:hypothetical protein|nr:hypothetical protein [Verrucomicrobiota bacterium]
MCASQENSNSGNQLMAIAFLLSLFLQSCSKSEKTFPLRMEVDYVRVYQR